MHFLAQAGSPIYARRVVTSNTYPEDRVTTEIQEERIRQGEDQRVL
jgi:hypothetical protein